MLTPQEVSTTAFKKASIGGYNMSQVDDFLDVLTADYGVLYSENAVLKSKMKVLVEKVEEYQATEVAMRKALMTAQRMADEMVSEAELRRTAILKEAEDVARFKVAEIRKEREQEEVRLGEAQHKSALFIAQARVSFTQGLEFIDHVNELLPEAAVQEQIKDETADAVEASVQRLLADAMQDISASSDGYTKKINSDQDLSPQRGAGANIDIKLDGEDQMRPDDMEDTVIKQEKNDRQSSHSRPLSDDLEFGLEYEIK